MMPIGDDTVLQYDWLIINSSIINLALALFFSLGLKMSSAPYNNIKPWTIYATTEDDSVSLSLVHTGDHTGDYSRHSPVWTGL